MYISSNYCHMYNNFTLMYFTSAKHYNILSSSKVFILRLNLLKLLKQIVMNIRYA